MTSDAATLLTSFGRTDDPARDECEITGEGATDLTDLATVLVEFGAICP